MAARVDAGERFAPSSRERNVLRPRYFQIAYGLEGRSVRLGCPRGMRRRLCPRPRVRPLARDPYIRADETDYEGYWRQAAHLLDGSSGPEDTFMPFGYSALIALGMALRLPPIWLPLAQVGAGVATCALCAVVARRVSGSPRAGAAAAWLAALYPPFIYYVDFLFTVVTAAAIVALALALASGGLARARERAATGLALGAAAVWRTNLALIPVLWGLGALATSAISARSGGDRSHARPPALGVLAWAVLPIGLATLRASLLLGAPTGPATNGGINFLLAHSHWTEVHLPYVGPDTPGGTRVVHFFRNRRRAQEAVYTTAEPVFRERPLYAAAWRDMKHDPLRELWRLPLALLDGMGLGREGYYPRVFWFHRLLDGDAIMAWTRVPMGIGMVLPALVWSTGGLRRLVRVRSAAMPLSHPVEGLLVATIGTAIATFALFLSEPRMRVPFDPAFIVAAVLSAREVLGRWRARRRSLEDAESASPNGAE